MENREKRRLFELLEPKSALVLGIVSGVLVICTIGFIALSALALTRGLNCSVKAAGNKTATTAQTAETGPVAEAPKSDKPVVELFVMSYCPYGLQMEKAYLPVMELLKGKAEMDVKFVNYAMHEKKEIDENTRQYCIEKEQPTKFTKYLSCFAGNADLNICFQGSEEECSKAFKAAVAACYKEAGVSESKVNSCMTKADKEFGITASYDNKESWLSGRYPIYPVHSGLNEQYGVQGSPTLVINGAQIDAGRSPEAVKQAVCAAFNNPPSECSETLNSQSVGAGFGTSAGAATDASCS